MNKEGYFIECEQCGSTNIKELEPAMNNITNKLTRTFKCLNCGKVDKETD